MATENHVKVTPSSFAVPTRHSAGSPVKESPFLFKYTKILLERVYRPVKPLFHPLLKQMRLVFLLIILLIISLIGNYQNWVEQKEYEKSVNQKLIIEKEIYSWEKILETKPEYRDVLLKLSLLNWQLYQTDQAKIYWEKASYLDPNNREVQEVGKIIF